MLVCLIVAIIVMRKKASRYPTPSKASRRQTPLCKALSRIRCKSKCCKKRIPRPLTSFFQSERLALQEEIEKSAMDHEIREKTRHRIENQGKNDSFFAGEEFKDFEQMNPNVDMGF